MRFFAVLIREHLFGDFIDHKIANSVAAHLIRQLAVQIPRRGHGSPAEGHSSGDRDMLSLRQDAPRQHGIGQNPVSPFAQPPRRPIAPVPIVDLYTGGRNMSSMLTDQTLICRLCEESFVFSAGEQELQRLRGLDRVPTRCSPCRRRPPTVPWIPGVVSFRPRR